MAEKYTGGSRILYKPEGEHCKVEDQDEYDRAKAAGWSDDVPKDWNNVPDKANPGATIPPKPTSPVPPAKDASATKASPAASASVLDGTVAEIADYVDDVTDVHALQQLRAQEVKGANRAGALKAIDDRMAELKA
jgi:hypothetical protein